MKQEFEAGNKRNQQLIEEQEASIREQIQQINFLQEKFKNLEELSDNTQKSQGEEVARADTGKALLEKEIERLKQQLSQRELLQQEQIQTIQRQN